MEQVHKRFTAEHVRNLFRGYSSGLLDRAAVEEVLGIGKTRFFALLKLYRKDPERFTLAYQRSTPGKLSDSSEFSIFLLFQDSRRRRIQEFPDCQGWPGGSQ